MATQHLTLRNNNLPSPLDRPFFVGKTLNFQSSSLNLEPDHKVHIDNSNVNLHWGNNILLHISIRRAENRIIFDTQRGSAWDDRLEVIPLRGVFTGRRPTIGVVARANSYDIFFDGRRLHSYTKRIIADATAISYRTNPNQSLVFSNPIEVDVFEPGQGPYSM